MNPFFMRILFLVILPGMATWLPKVLF